MSYHVDGFHNWKVRIVLLKGSLHKTRILQNVKSYRLHERLPNDEFSYNCLCEREADDSNPFITLIRKLERQGYKVVEGREVSGVPLGYTFLAYIHESRDWGVLTVWKKP